MKKTAGIILIVFFSFFFFSCAGLNHGDIVAALTETENQAELLKNATDLKQILKQVEVGAMSTDEANEKIDAMAITPDEKKEKVEKLIKTIEKLQNMIK